MNTPMRVDAAEPRCNTPSMFDRHLDLWNLTPDGEPIATWGSRLLPVRRGCEPAMLKIGLHAEEAFGGLLLGWWDGCGAARLLASDDNAILIERALGTRSLSAFARDGRDDEATRILCDVVAELHAPRGKPLPEALVPLDVWFRDLEAVSGHGGILARAAAEARSLLAEPREITVLHGDIHHDNVLDFETRGWLAIDPKRLRGERAFDYANLFCNPDVGDRSCRVAIRPDIFSRRLATVVERSGLERRRLLRWIIAWTGLSAMWFIEDGKSPDVDFRIAELAIAALDG
jgi:streptomycin 6-kinase